MTWLTWHHHHTTINPQVCYKTVIHTRCLRNGMAHVCSQDGGGVLLSVGEGTQCYKYDVSATVAQIYYCHKIKEEMLLFAIYVIMYRYATCSNMVEHLHWAKRPIDTIPYVQCVSLLGLQTIIFINLLIFFLITHLVFWSLNFFVQPTF